MVFYTSHLLHISHVPYVPIFPDPLVCRPAGLGPLVFATLPPPLSATYCGRRGAPPPPHTPQAARPLHRLFLLNHFRSRIIFAPHSFVPLPFCPPISGAPIVRLLAWSATRSLRGRARRAGRPLRGTAAGRARHDTRDARWIPCRYILIYVYPCYDSSTIQS